MAEEQAKSKGAGKPEAGEVTFKCQNCDKYKNIEEMRIVTRFFPLMVVCRECEKEMR